MSGFKDHFSSHAAGYATYRPVYPPELAAWAASIAPAQGVALDVGCGSGQFSLLLADRFDRVIAIDPSAKQIANAAPHPKVDYRVAPAEATGLADASVDLLTVAQAAHWFDLPAFFTEAKRVLRPGGMLMLISYAGMEKAGPVEAWLEHFRLDTMGPWWPPERRIVENGYRDIIVPLPPIAAPPFHLEVQWNLDELIGYLDTWSAVRAMERSIGREQFHVAVEELRAIWGNDAGRRTFRWRLNILAGRA